ncbi:hypothetical protein JOE61_003858 [Nocardioides salarius]|uniref:Uncharacterized protein n=1 Tax=Nocardioides salarius TaxID=374513 RepID=A0ABS2MFT6_9ACTN|nr:hypothetical protein [Nocardioides salarius]MBM7510044.1 hypothetical protein [Nocardioides salarius]
MKNSLKYGAGLLAIYLIVYNGSKSGTVLTKGAAGSAQIIKAFQGR